MSTNIKPTPNTFSRSQFQDLPVEILLPIIELCRETNTKNLINISLVNRRLRSVCIPLLFKTVRLRMTGEELNDSLRIVNKNERIISSVRYLQIHILKQKATPSNKSADTVSLLPLTEALVGMKLLKEFAICFLRNRNPGLDPFDYAASKTASCPVSTLLCQGLINYSSVPGMFPDLHTLSIQISNSQEFVHSFRQIGTLRNLEALEVRKFGWTLSDLQEIIKLFPELRCLFVKGSLNKVKVSEMVTELGKLSQLKTLAITTEQYVPIAKWPLYDSDYEEIERQVETHPLNEGKSANAQTIFRMCPGLNSAFLKPDWYHVTERSKLMTKVIKRRIATHECSTADEWPRLTDVIVGQLK